MIRIIVSIFCFVKLLSFSQAQISINTSVDSIYVYDDFSISGEVLNEFNGITGEGWEGNWLYQGGKTSGVAVGDGYIYSTADGFGVQRELANPIRFVGSTFYVSFLFKKEPTGEFRISGNRFSDNVDRFGVHIAKEGKLGAQVGVSYQNTVFSELSYVENDKTYLVVAKYYYTDKLNMNISVFEDDESIPSGEPEMWDLQVEGVNTGMEAIEYFRLAFTSASVCLDEFKLGDSWQSVNDTRVESALPEVLPNQQVDSEVFVIEPEELTQSKEWAFTVEEDGNYQLGYAWLWVKGESNQVGLHVLINEDTVKHLNATPEVAPYRYETRLENLKSGDKITISAVSDAETAYRLSGRISFATPTFHELSTFSVHDYGALGDGTTNDYDAVKQACDAARRSGGGVVVFDGTKTYRIIGPKGYTLFNLKNANNVSIMGNGAKLIMHPNGNLASIKYAENIQIEGLTTTYDPLPYYQGQIDQINLEGLYLDMTVPVRYDAPEVGDYNPDHAKFGRSFWETGDNRTGEGRHLTIVRTELIDAEAYKVRVYLAEGETADLLHSKNNNATHYIVPHIEYGHNNGYRDSPYCEVAYSSRVKVKDVLTQSVCHFAFNVGGNYGPITFSNVDMLAPNREEDLHVSWRDGWHVWGNRYGIMIEDGDYDGGLMYDDIFSPHMVMPKVSQVSGQSVTLISKSGESSEKYTSNEIWQAGDLVSFWNDDQSVYYGMARIVEVADTTRQNLIAFALDEEVPNISSDAYVINEEAINRDMVIRNCTSTPQGRVIAVRQRTPILYQDCTFENIHFWTYSGESYRTKPRHIRFENCSINERLDFNIDDTWNLSMKGCDLNGASLDLSNVRNFYLDGGTLSSAALKKSNLHIFGDAEINQEALTKDGFSSINYTEPVSYTSGIPPFLPEVEPAVIFASEPFNFEGERLADLGSGEGWQGNWQSIRGGGLSLNDSLSLKYAEDIKLNTSGGMIQSVASIAESQRYFEQALNLGTDEFYVSFLASRDEAGEFDFVTANEEYTRFGIYVESDGSVAVQSGNSVVVSPEGLFDNGPTYFVLVKYTNANGSSAVTRLKLFNLDEHTSVPEEENEVVWDVQSNPATTGVEQSNLQIKTQGGEVKLDQIIIGNSYQSVIYDSNYRAESDTTQTEEGNVLRINVKDIELKVRYTAQGVIVDLPYPNGAMHVFDLSGRLALYAPSLNADHFALSESSTQFQDGIYTLVYSVDGSDYVRKVLIR
ncbi:MAG: hypothetical protein ABJ004_16520 [Cyclobacteriaceae bacterium]